MAHNFTPWVLDAIASRKIPDRVRSCRVCGKTEREGIDGFTGHVPNNEIPEEE
jgi:hypothetical protein